MHANYTKRVDKAQGRRCLDADDLEALVEATEGVVEVLPPGIKAQEMVVDQVAADLEEVKEIVWMTTRMFFSIIAGSIMLGKR